MILALSYTRLGRATRAVADNPVLAGIKGINADTVGRLVNFVGMEPGEERRRDQGLGAC